MKKIDNEKLLTALKDRNHVISAINGYTDEYDDEQLLKIQKFNNLTQFEKDLMYLCATEDSIIKVAKLYSCSRQYIYKLLNKIKQKL
jgi:hypothetical protein